MESIERTSKWFYKYFTFSALALIALGAIFVTIYVNTTSKKVAHEVTEIAEKKIKITLEFNDWYSKGAGEYLDEKYKQAVDSFTKALDKVPDNDSAAYTYNYRGAAYLGLSKNDEALADFNNSTKLKPENPLPYHNRVEIYYKRNDYKRAYGEYKKAIELYDIKGKDTDALVFSVKVKKLFDKVEGEDEIKKFIMEKIEELGKRLIEQGKLKEIKIE